MNVVLLDPGEVSPSGGAVLAGRRAAHVAGVLKKEPGETLKVGLVGGQLGHASVASASVDELVLVGCAFDSPPPPKRPVTLVLALPRPPVLRRLLQHVAALGVERVVLVHSARVQKSYWQTPALRPSAVAETLRLGLEQAVDTVPPAVERAGGLRAFVRERVGVLARGGQLVVAHPGGRARCPTDVAVPTVLCVGPEGGFVPEEVEALQAAGAHLVSLGSRILRVETAVVALLGRLG